MVSRLLEGLRHKLHARGDRRDRHPPGVRRYAHDGGVQEGRALGGPRRVARDIVKAVDRRAGIVYTPRGSGAGS
jgi:hypothetical protein